MNILSKKEIQQAVLELSPPYQKLITVKYDPLATTNPFTFTPKFSFLPVINFLPEFNSYMINLRPVSKLLPQQADMLLKVAEDVKKIANLCKIVNAFYQIHKTL